MKPFRSRYARRVLMPVMAVSLLSACHHWKVQETAPAQVVTENQPDRVRLTMLDSTRVELREPQVSGSEILGKWNWDQDWYGGEPALRRVAIDSVSYVEIRKTAIVNTVLLGFLGATVVGIVVYGIVYCPKCFCGFDNPPC